MLTPARAHRLALPLAVLAALATAPAARALIHTDLVVCVGVELAPSLGERAATREAELARHGLRVFVTPSLVVGDDKPTYRYVLARVLGTLPLDRAHDLIALPLPDPTLRAEVAAALAAAGHPGEPRLFAIVQHAGGR